MKFIKLFEEYEGMLQTSPDIDRMTPEELEGEFKHECYKTNPNVDLVKQIIDHPDFSYFLNSELSGRNSTPLMLASIGNHPEIVQHLLGTEGITINTRNKDGYTALSDACRNGCVEIVEIFLARPDIKVNLQDKGGWTPLMWACLKNQPEIVGMLLQHPDTDISITTKDGATAWFNAKPEIREMFPQLEVVS
jgi:hypothetical protein